MNMIDLTAVTMPQSVASRRSGRFETSSGHRCTIAPAARSAATAATTRGSRTCTTMGAGIFTPCDELAREFVAASEVSGEKFWRLPMEESYWESMKSSVADMLNTGPMQPKGGAITAALFLKQFVTERVQWMHIDIAGPVWNHKKRAATGFGVATLVEWVLCNSSS